MVPHDPVEGTRIPIETRQAAAGPRDGVQDAANSEAVELSLVAVGQCVAQFDELLVFSPVAGPPGARSPSAAARRDLPVDAANSESLEVLIETAKIGIATVNQSVLRSGGNEQDAVALVGSAEPDQLFGRQLMKVSSERLELGDHTQDIGVSDGPPDLQGASWTVDLAHGGVGRGQRLDRRPAGAEPGVQRDRPGVGHIEKIQKIMKDLKRLDDCYRLGRVAA